jgi:DNA-binding Lrp family transcriptional regulator
MKAYVLVETEMGQIGKVAEQIQGLEMTEAQLLAADAVTGPFDVIVIVETTDLETLIHSVTDRIQTIGGVKRTITCVT